MKSIKGVELIEPERSGRETYCTGDGGIEVTHPKAAAKIAARRMWMLLDTGAERIVTTCPACIAMLRLGLKLVKPGRNVDVIDLVDLVYELLSREL